MGNYQCCTRCIMDNISDKSITFDADGHCNYCTDVLKRMPNEYFPNEEGRKKLNSIITKIKADCKDNRYDCIVGVSGGIDSSYILYLGGQYGLRMLAIHVDDGFDNPVATENLKKLTDKLKTEMVTIHVDTNEYMDVIKSFFKASVRGIAIPQDNLINGAVHKYARDCHIRYSLDGSNMAHECILERGTGGVNACDKRFILSVQKQFGTIPIKNLKFISLTDRYIKQKFASPVVHIRPLNYIRYNIEDAIKQLEDFCGFEYYGGKHYESILTRFLQCYYLPQKFGQDKRKSHFSSLIVSGQMTREEALERIKLPLYPSKEMLENDKAFIAKSIGCSIDELDGYIAQPPKVEMDYAHSILEHAAPLARKLRKIIE